MLNEIYLLRNGIAEINTGALERIHRSLSEPGKSDVLRVILEQNKTDGSISELEFLEGEKNKIYWTQGDGNKNQFPAVKLPFPLRPSGVAEFGLWKKDNKTPSTEKLLAYLSELRQCHPINLSKQQHWPNYRKKLQERAVDYQNLENDSAIVASLLNLFLGIERDGLTLLNELDKKLWEECQRNTNKEMLRMTALILFAGGEELTPKGLMRDGKRPTLLLDLKNKNTRSAANKCWKSAISSLYVGANNTGNGTCAISGKENVRLVDRIFQAPKCEHLGPVKLFSRKKGVQTYKRYRKLEADSMAVSVELVDELASALRYLNHKERGTTWDVLPSETGKGDLLLAFCRALPDIEPIRLLTYDDSVDEFGEDDYEFESRQICESFQGRDIDLTEESRVDFLVLRKISDGVQKAIFSSSLPLQKLGYASENWTEAGKNAPSIPLMFFKKGDKTPRFSSRASISPKQFAFLFKKHYTCEIDGKQPTVPGLPFAEVMTLFVSEQCDLDLANHLLNKLLKQFSNLLEQASLDKTNPRKHHRDSRYAISAISILLYKLNRNKEVYMNELAYKLGQFCSVLDEIHTGYCSSERKGQMPIRLVGNQAYAAAVINPIKSLEITAQRFAVYQAWARRNSQKADSEFGKNDEKIKNAKYAYFWFRDNCDDLHNLIPEKLSVATPVSKAELLLGYLAGRPIVKRITT